MVADAHQNSVPDAQKYMGWGLGGVVGAGVTFAVYVFGWVFLGGPLQELFEERVLDPWRRRKNVTDTMAEPTSREAEFQSSSAESASGKEQGDRYSAPNYRIPGYRILVSDLHIDSWQEKHPERTDAFLNFLRCVRETPQVTEIYLNGDLLDLPLHPIHEGKDEPVTLDIEEDLKIELCRTAAHQQTGVTKDEEKWQGVLPKHLDRIFVALRDATGYDRQPPLHAYYLTGNHDIGISGLRFFRPDLLGLPAQAIWNPSAFILGPRHKEKQGKRQAVYIEHGHLHDPLLWLYMRYAVFDLLRGGLQRRERDMFRGLQRGGKCGMAGPLKDESRPTGLQMGGESDGIANVLATWKRGLLELGPAIVRYRYRHAARRAHRRLSARRPDLNITTIILGHTHLDERHSYPDGWEYINAGSWSGNTGNQTYWVIKPDGGVTGPHQWQQGGRLDLV
ncbi:MAG TPA: hypothetical protein VF600_01050 [Abditibacteriaceae bacterium]|jgi:UDP-2,3-diacylglucosamine pyrophosphatase LpxH